MKGFPDLPPLWLLAFMALAWVLARFVPLALAPSAPLQAAGLALAAGGVGLILWSALWFWNKKTTIEPHHEPQTLIVEGPYRLGRNPIYLGMILILTGQILWLGALSPVLLPLAFLIVLTERFAKPEEEAILAAFGTEGRTYLSATRRWI